MKTLQYIRALAPVLLIACMPTLLQGQQITITRGASMTVSGPAIIVLQDEQLNDGTIRVGRNGVSINGNSQNEEMARQWKSIQIDNILFRRNPSHTIVSLDKTRHNLAALQSSIQAYPNPTTDRFMLTIASDKDVAETITLQNGLGLPLEQMHINLKAGINIIRWNLDKYTPGIYVLAFQHAPVKYLKIVKQ
ncbi:MAG TPA: T9SS type A sorting domain-containing protein [Chitinophagaceae bacterium]|nr:T9SS type A sorting domain-containing protein [Chitinophagaceae bacterium]